MASVAVETNSRPPPSSHSWPLCTPHSACLRGSVEAGQMAFRWAAAPSGHAHFPRGQIVFKNILLATDGSPASGHAAQLAVSLARENGARLTALYVIEPYPYLGVGEASAVGFQAYMSQAYEHAAQAHARISDLCAQGGGHVDLQLRRGEDAHAADSIVQAAVEEQ